jgi:hypothetical protein
MSSFDITKVKKLTRESVEQPKITLEALKRMCSFLDEENPATYEIFLKHRTDLGESEVAYYQDIIQTLKENIKLKQQIINETMGGYEDCINVAPPSVIYDTKVNHIHNPC